MSELIFKPVISIYGGDIGGTTIGPAIDSLGFETVDFLFMTSNPIAHSGGGTFTLSLKESDTTNVNANMDAVSASNIIGTLPTGIVIDSNSDNTIYKFGYRGHRRYLRLTVTLAGVIDFFHPFGIALLSNPKKFPYE